MGCAGIRCLCRCLGQMLLLPDWWLRFNASQDDGLSLAAPSCAAVYCLRCRGLCRDCGHALMLQQQASLERER